MRPKTMILFVIAVGCGLVASIGVSQYMESGALGQAVETEQIFVAVTDITIGEKLDAQNVKLEEWPRDRVPEGSVRELEELEDRFPRTRLYAGEPILQAKLMDSRDRGSTALTIPKGFRVVSVKVTVESSVSGLVRPGDRVDLMVFLRKSGEVPETGTRTILRDVNVFSVDGETERSVDENGDARSVRTVSLLVRPEQAEAVTLASELGQLYLSLRRPDDETEDISEGVSVNSLLGSSAESANEKDRDQKDNDVRWLDPLDIDAPQETVAEVEPTWTMRILTPSGVKEYQWTDNEQLPEEVGGSGQSDMAPPLSPRPTQPFAEPTPVPADPGSLTEDLLPMEE